MPSAPFRGLMRAALVALSAGLLASYAGADELADFRTAIDRANAQYQHALRVLETRGREETTVEVERLRESWQAVIDRFGSKPPAPYADDDLHAITFTEIDARIVGALIVIGFGSREAARDALAPIGETLARLRVKSAPQSSPPSP
jgi:hypothetical protein